MGLLTLVRTTPCATAILESSWVRWLKLTQPLCNNNYCAIRYTMIFTYLPPFIFQYALVAGVQDL